MRKHDFKKKKICLLYENTFLSFPTFDYNANVGNNTEDKIGDSTIVDLQYFLALTP